MKEFYHNFTDLKQISTCISEASSNKNDIVRQAEDILGHHFQLFGFNVYDYNGKISWDKDPLYRNRWILLRNKPLLLSLKKNKDIKFIWELNRHQHLYYLGKAFLLTKDKRYADEITAEITDWIENVSPGGSVNWMSALEISIRIFSWVWALNLADWQDTVDRTTANRIKQSIFAQTKFVENNLQIREFCNNHLIGEAACLALVGILFPNFATSGSWLKKGLNILDEQIKKQIFDDGVDKEQAIDYHRFVLDFYTFVVILCNKNNISLPKGLLNKLEKMYEALFYSMRPDGFLPIIGDDDSARVAKLSEDSGRNSLSALSTGAVLFNRGDMKWAAKKFHEESLWLLGLEGYNQFNCLKEYTPKYSSFGLKESGQYIMRSGWDKDALYMYFDCGPQGMGQAGHGHADALSFELFTYGKPLIIDSGTYTYNGPKEWRNYFRGTSAHNTVLIDKVDQSEHLKPYDQFGWERKADAYNLAWYSSNCFDFVSGYHNGYLRLSDPVIHQRSILFVKPEYWIITDFLKGKNEHEFSVLYHFSPGNVLLDKNTHCCRTYNRDEANILVAPVNIEGTKSQIFEGNLKPIQGWVSYKYGDKLKASVLEYSQKDKLPIAFTTILYPYSPKNNEASEISIRKIPIAYFNLDKDCLFHANSYCSEIKIGEIRDYYLESYYKNTQKIFADFKTDAEMIYFREENNKMITKLFMLNGSFLTKNDIPIIVLEKTASRFEINIKNSELDINVSDSISLKLFLQDIKSQKVNGVLKEVNKRNEHIFINP